MYVVAPISFIELMIMEFQGITSKDCLNIIYVKVPRLLLDRLLDLHHTPPLPCHHLHRLCDQATECPDNDEQIVQKLVVLAITMSL